MERISTDHHRGGSVHAGAEARGGGSVGEGGLLVSMRQGRKDTWPRQQGVTADLDRSSEGKSGPQGKSNAEV